MQVGISLDDSADPQDGSRNHAPADTVLSSVGRVGQPPLSHTSAQTISGRRSGGLEHSEKMNTQDNDNVTGSAARYYDRGNMG